MSFIAPAPVVSGPESLVGRESIAWAVEKLVRTAVACPDGALDSRSAIEIVLHEHAHADGPELTASREAFSMSVEHVEDTRRVSISAADDRGYVYAILEIADRLADAGLHGIPDGMRVSEAPATPVRSVQRMFSSVHEDLPWFHDRRFWADYLDHLASQRFNRFQLGFGMQYNYGTGWESRTASDNYFCFLYPFVLDVPGHRVRAQGVDAQERARNLASLAFIARETRRRGMDFCLGLWNHAYDFAHDSPQWYPILGVSQENHAQYSADAIGVLLREIPEINALTFRVHHEGGVHEEGHEVFWGHVFSAISDVGRSIDVDMHAKGVDQALIDAVHQPNIRPMISGKYWAEHMGLPYHQASIRQRELTPIEYAGKDASVTGVTDGERRFTRYGYADFLSEDRPIDFMFRMWPGTQKLLLWGDPVFAAGFGRFATIGGSLGLEFCEPLFFKGRKGTGVPGGRELYENIELRQGIDDWKKYAYTYLLWGRLLYNPDAEPATWQRLLRAQYGAAAEAVENALAPLSRILPLVTVVHGAGGSNNFYWPEIYVDLAVSHWKQSSHYAFDLSTPRTWEGATPFDPTMFYGIGEYADDALSGEFTAKYSPLEVATWIDEMVSAGESALSSAEGLTADDPQTIRTLVDIRILIRLGRFFSAKFRAATDYALYARTGDRGVLERAIAALSTAHEAYADITPLVKGVYRDDLAFGVGVSERGSWSDRTMAMREDLFLLKEELSRAPAGAVGRGERHAIAQRAERPTTDMTLDVASHFTRGEPLKVRLGGVDDRVTGALVRYRHLNQAEAFQSARMVEEDGGFAALIPAQYTDSGFPLVIFAEVELQGRAPIMVPGLNADLANQPYLVVHSSQWEARG